MSHTNDDWLLLFGDEHGSIAEAEPPLDEEALFEDQGVNFLFSGGGGVLVGLSNRNAVNTSFVV